MVGTKPIDFPQLRSWLSLLFISGIVRMSSSIFITRVKSIFEKQGKGRKKIKILLNVSEKMRIKKHNPKFGLEIRGKANEKCKLFFILL
jgi:hypothetical protein